MEDSSPHPPHCEETPATGEAQPGHVGQDTCHTRLDKIGEMEYT